MRPLQSSTDLCVEEALSGDSKSQGQGKGSVAKLLPESSAERAYDHGSIVEQAMGNMAVQNNQCQLGALLSQINELQELAQGQNQMILMATSQTPIPTRSEASGSAEREWDSVMEENPNVDQQD